MEATTIGMLCALFVAIGMAMNRKEIEQMGRNVGLETDIHCSLANKILEYLLTNPNKVFSQRELSEVFCRSEQQVRQTCLNLVKVGKVDRLVNEHAQKNEARYFYGVNLKFAQKMVKVKDAVNEATAGMEVKKEG